VLFVDVPFQEFSIRRILVDVPFGEVDLALIQKTSGVAARSSGGLPEERWLGHAVFYRRSASGVRNPSAVRCPLSAVRCPLSAVRCPLSAVRCPLSAVRCPLSGKMLTDKLENPNEIRVL
jgi:hypothetical protein